MPRLTHIRFDGFAFSADRNIWLDRSLCACRSYATWAFIFQNRKVAHGPRLPLHPNAPLFNQYSQSALKATALQGQPRLMQHFFSVHPFWVTLNDIDQQVELLLWFDAIHDADFDVI